jgi:hypothetical protein
LDGFFASGFGRFIGRVTVRYHVQMIFGIRVSEFEKNEEIISKKVLAFQQHAEFGVEESCGGETASRQRARRQMPRKITSVIGKAVGTLTCTRTTESST